MSTTAHLPPVPLPTGDFSGYIFDCDGTLADSMPAHFKAWEAAFRANGARFDFTWKDFYGQAGMGMYESVRYFNDLHGDALDPAAVVAAYNEQMLVEHAAVLPIEPVVTLARELGQSHPVAVASGGSRAHVTETLRLIGLEGFFRVVVTKDDVANGKPAPDSFLLAAEKMGVPAQECLVFEDAPLGLKAAKAAGMQAVYIDPMVYSARV